MITCTEIFVHNHKPYLDMMIFTWIINTFVFAVICTHTFLYTQSYSHRDRYLQQLLYGKNNLLYRYNSVHVREICFNFWLMVVPNKHLLSRSMRYLNLLLCWLFVMSSQCWPYWLRSGIHFKAGNSGNNGV